MKKMQGEWLDHFSTGIFADINQKKEQLLAEGRTVYNLSIGTPDFPPEEHVMKAVSESAKDPKDWVYALRDIPELQQAVVDYYQRRFGVTITADQVEGVHGSQEGIGHLFMALCDEGDTVLLPDPGYPIFEAGAYLGKTDIYLYELREENNFLPVLDEIPEDVARKAKLMMVSYPYNPVAKAAPKEFYDELIAFARKYDIFIVHDNAYSDIIFDGREGGSFLQHEGAMEVGAEFFSMSKSFNVTGSRLSFMIGRKDAVDALKLLRTQIGFGTFIPIQRGAVAALNGPRDMVERQCQLYQDRRDALCGGLREIGWNVPDSEGTMFVWAPVPEGYTSRSFTMALMEKAGVLCTPGDAFGRLGEGYVRFALVYPPEVMAEIVKTIKDSGVLSV